MRLFSIAPVLVLAAGLAAVTGFADDDKTVSKTVIPVKLENPSGIAVHAKTGHVFIAATSGVYRMDPKSKKVYPEIAGFPVDVYGKGPKYNIGPLGVAFLDDAHLVVGDGSQLDGSELVRVFKVAAAPPSKPAEASSAAFNLGPIAPGDASPKGEGNFYGVAVNPSGIFITSNGDDTKGWVLRAEVKDGKPGELKPFIATKPLVNVDAPVGITSSADGKQLVIGQMGEINVPNDSLLCFYSAEDGKLISSHKTNLHDITGLAYSPKTGKLYATDFAWSDTTKGGLFELHIKDGEAHSHIVAGIDKPTALAFDAAGNLYVTAIGTPKEGSKDPAGMVVVFPAGL